jgi:hypothetical protein
VRRLEGVGRPAASARRASPSFSRTLGRVRPRNDRRTRCPSEVVTSARASHRPSDRRGSCLRSHLVVSRSPSQSLACRWCWCPGFGAVLCRYSRPSGYARSDCPDRDHSSLGGGRNASRPLAVRRGLIGLMPTPAVTPGSNCRSRRAARLTPVCLGTWGSFTANGKQAGPDTAVSCANWTVRRAWRPIRHGMRPRGAETRRMTEIRHRQSRRVLTIRKQQVLGSNPSVGSSLSRVNLA